MGYSTGVYSLSAASLSSPRKPGDLSNAADGDSSAGCMSRGFRSARTPQRHSTFSTTSGLASPGSGMHRRISSVSNMTVMSIQSNVSKSSVDPIHQRKLWPGCAGEEVQIGSLGNMREALAMEALRRREVLAEARKQQAETQKAILRKKYQNSIECRDASQEKARKARVADVSVRYCSSNFRENMSKASSDRGQSRPSSARGQSRPSSARGPSSRPSSEKGQSRGSSQKVTPRRDKVQQAPQRPAPTPRQRAAPTPRARLETSLHGEPTRYIDPEPDRKLSVSMCVQAEREKHLRMRRQALEREQDSIRLSLEQQKRHVREVHESRRHELQRFEMELNKVRQDDVEGTQHNPLRKAISQRQIKLAEDQHNVDEVDHQLVQHHRSRAGTLVDPIEPGFRSRSGTLVDPVQDERGRLSSTFSTRSIGAKTAAIDAKIRPPGAHEVQPSCRLTEREYARDVDRMHRDRAVSDADHRRTRSLELQQRKREMIKLQADREVEQCRVKSARTHTAQWNEGRLRRWGTRDVSLGKSEGDYSLKSLGSMSASKLFRQPKSLPPQSLSLQFVR